MKAPKFFYVVTIHNKQDFLPEVISGLANVASSQSTVIFVLDGCTDGSKSICENFAATSELDVHLLETQDVHEVLSLNAGFECVLSLSANDDDIVVTCQDDVVLADGEFELHAVKFLSEFALEPVGIVSMRAGAAPRLDLFRGRILEQNLIESAFGHGVAHRVLPEGHFIRTSITIRSPEFVRVSVLRDIGVLDVAFAPYAYDSHDLSLRAFLAGYNNYVLAVPFFSPLAAGGTRQNAQPNFAQIHRRHARLLFKKYWRRLIKIPVTEFQQTAARPAFVRDTAFSNGLVSVTPDREHEEDAAAEPELLSVAARRCFNAAVRVSGILQALQLRLESYAFMAARMAPRSGSDGESIDPLIDYGVWLRQFHRAVPELIREHRFFVEREKLGYGERVFHAMWWHIFNEYRPKTCLEIGVHRGQVLSLWGLCARLLGEQIFVAGVSPLDGLGDSVSNYVGSSEGYRQSIRRLHEHFSLSQPELIEARSEDPVAVSFVSSRAWDLVYIDGSHDFEVVQLDVQNAIDSLTVGGILVLDDATLDAVRALPLSAFPGHRGPTAAARQLNQNRRFRSIGSVGHNVVYLKVAA